MSRRQCRRQTHRCSALSDWNTEDRQTTVVYHGGQLHSARLASDRDRRAGMIAEQGGGGGVSADERVSI